MADPGLVALARPPLLTTMPLIPLAVESVSQFPHHLPRRAPSAGPPRHVGLGLVVALPDGLCLHPVRHSTAGSAPQMCVWRDWGGATAYEVQVALTSTSHQITVSPGSVIDGLLLQVRTDPGLRPAETFRRQLIRSCNPQAADTVPVAAGQGPSGLNASPVTPAWLSRVFPERRRERNHPLGANRFGTLITC